MREGMQVRSITRMNEITAIFAQMPDVLAVAAFGSNAQRERFDDYSDLDFLVLVTAEAKQSTIAQVSQMKSIWPIDAMQIVYGDAVQLLFADGVFCDFGIVTQDQLATFPHGTGKYLWRREDWKTIDLSAIKPPKRSKEMLATDTLFHLYVGLLRAERGEEAAALYEVQLAAAQCVLTLLEGEKADAFSSLRHAEQLLPNDTIRALMPGYGHTREAARTMLKHLSFAQHTPLYQAVLCLLNS